MPDFYETIPAVPASRYNCPIMSRRYNRNTNYITDGVSTGTFLTPVYCLPVVTGQRPFLPHLSPGQWVDLVEGKQSDHIAVFETLEAVWRIRILVQKETSSIGKCVGIVCRVAEPEPLHGRVGSGSDSNSGSCQ